MWHALDGPQRRFALGDDRARRYLEDVGPFCAVPDEPEEDNFVALRDLVGPGNVALLLRGEVTAPEDWELLDAFDVVQMIGPRTPASRSVDPRVSALGSDDVEEMMSLTARTRPGPFARRTLELGTYLGIRVDGRLAAMAGQRAQTEEYVEVSAVCTDEEFLGRGLASALINAQVELVLAEGKVPMLHAAASNVRALVLYEHLGFQHRRTVDGVIMRAPLDVAS